MGDGAIITHTTRAPVRSERGLRIFEALSHPARLQILEVLGQQEGCFCGDFVGMLGMAQSTISHHLKVLKEAGLVKGTAKGTWVCYCLDMEGLDRARRAVLDHLRFSRHLAQEVAKVSEKEQAIKESVLQHYGQKARAQLQRLAQPLTELPMLETSACCSIPTADATTAGALEELPQDITEFSLGCGNPVGIASIQLGETVLDLGSGGGLDCFLAARAAGAEGHVIGVDMNPEMLQLARKNAARLGASNVEFRLGELEHLPVEACAVDLVISNCVINLVPDKDAVFREAFRVLKSGGRLCVADIVAAAPLADTLVNDPQQWCGCIAGAIPLQEYLERLRAAGFQQTEALHADAWNEVQAQGAQLLSAVISATKA